MFSVALVCLSDCAQDYSKRCEQILRTFVGHVEVVEKEQKIVFVGDLTHRAMSLFKGFSSVWDENPVQDGCHSKQLNHWGAVDQWLEKASLFKPLKCGWEM